MDSVKITQKAHFLSSPLLIREIRIFLRSNKAFLCLLLFLGALVITVMMNWAAFTEHWRPDRDIARGARIFFHSLASGHLYLIILFMPFLLAPSIVEEREKNTLDLLVSSPISIAHLVLAKLISPLLFVFMLLTAALPVLALCFLGGGLGMIDVLYAYIIMLATSVIYSCLGLLCSTLRSRVYEVYLVAVLMTVVLCLVIPFHGSLWRYITVVKWVEGGSINHGLEFLSPFYILRSLIYTPAGVARSTYIFIYLFITLALSGMMMITSFAIVRRIASGTAFGSDYKEDDDEDNDIIKAYARDYYISFDSTSQDGNPGLVLERRVQWFSRLPVLMRLFYSSLMLSILTLPLASYQGSWIFLSLPFISAAFFTLPLAATSISSDYERETIYLLRTSLLSSKQIVYAKFLSSLQYSFVIALALYFPGMAFQLFFSFMGYEVDLVSNFADTIAMIFYPVALFFSLLMYNAWGLLCSSYFRHSNKSLIVSGVIILVTICAPFLVPQIDFFALSSISYFLTFILMFLSPLAGIITLYPPGTIKYLERSLFEIRNLSEIPYIFPLFQCIFFLIITYFLLKKTIYFLEHND